jgi:modification methylase
MSNKPTQASAKFIVGSSEKASTLAPEVAGKVALCVTSPPYHNAISYESHQTDRDANYRIRTQIDYADEYLPFLDRVWTECWHLLKPGGHLAINVGSVLDQGFHFPLPQDIQIRLMESEVPWNFIRSIYWNKVTAGVKRAGSVIQHRLPGYWYPNIMTEHIIIVRKPGKVARSKEKFPPEWLENVWDLAPVPPRTIDHPAPFPEDLPHRLIRMLTAEGDYVVDPFNGAGATTKAAYDLGRNAVGFDLSQQYADYATKRLALPSAVRTNQLHVVPIHSKDFVPTKSRGQTRHGSGLASRRGGK